MADENKVLKTRIKSLYKTWAEWKEIEDKFKPLRGEICIADVPASSNAVNQEPALLIKVGDGEKLFKDLPWLSGLSADVHNWALKETLAWSDLSDAFKQSLASYVGAGNEYRINKNGEVYTLQTREYNATTGKWGEWSDVEDSSIDISNKTDRELTGTNGTALIFNETDGGGAKFEHNDGTNSFVGVNDGGKDGIAAQIYAIDKTNKVGSRINITKNGIYYTNGATSATTNANDELATKGDINEAINGLGAALRYIGMTELADGEKVEEALARIVVDYQATHAGYTLSEGAVAIVDAKEFIFNGTAWQEFGDEGLYETKADAQAAHDALQAAINSNSDAIAENAAAIAENKQAIEDNADAIAANKAELDKIPVIYNQKRVEITELPNTDKCTYKDLGEEVRVLINKDATFTEQTVGAGGDSNRYYITVKMIAPYNAVKYQEFDFNSNTWETEYQDVKTDTYGRKFDYSWLPVASKNADGTWTNFALNSTATKFVGWYLGAKWYDENDNLLGQTKFKVTLATEDTYDVLVSSETLKTINEITGEIDSLAKIAKTGNVNDLIQDDGDYLILDCNITIV